MANHPPALPRATQASSAASSNLGELLLESCTITACKASDRRGILLLLLRHRRRHRRHGRGRQHTPAEFITALMAKQHLRFQTMLVLPDQTQAMRAPRQKLAWRSSTAAAAAAAARFSIDTRTWHAGTAAHVTVYDVERRKRRQSVSKPVASKSRTATPVINKTPARSTHSARGRRSHTSSRSAHEHLLSSAQNLNKSRQISI